MRLLKTTQTRRFIKGTPFTFGQLSLVLAVVALVGPQSVSNSAAPLNRYVATTGTDSGSCTNQQAPCRTIGYGISQLVAGDTLIVANGTYTDVTPIRFVPSGNAGVDGVPGTADDVYTTIKAATDFGAFIDGRAWTGSYLYGIRLEGKSYIKVQGFRVFTNPSNANQNGPLFVASSHHIKIIRNALAGASTTGNTANASIGPDNDYVLLEENYAFGGARYQFLIYWSDHTVVRRNVARNDYWNDTLQSAAFTNYDSVNTVWQNNIAVDSDTSCCTVHSPLFAAFFNENKDDHAPDTTQEFHGNIVLNYQSYYGAHLDWLVSGRRTLSDNIYWDSNGGYWGDQGLGLTASFPAISNMTVGGMTGTYDGPNTGPARGTGISIYSNLSNSVKNSLFMNNRSFGVADYVNGRNNAFSGNGENYGGVRTAIPGAGDITNHNALYNAVTNPSGSVRYLPRGPENGSLLATAGDSGGRVGAQVLWKIGVDGTIYGQSGWNVVRNSQNGYGRAEDSLWPFPNEASIKSDMAAYNGPGLRGARGFALSGNGLYGGPRTLTSYIWEYLGNACPVAVCSPTASSGGGSSATVPPSAPTGLRIVN
ncbi:MAG: hypothetical protein ABL982_05505 [Vicinamibacterales bacterium]